VSLICGVLGAECRNAMDTIRIGNHPDFHQLNREDQKRLIRENPFRFKHYLIGTVAAFIAVVTLGEHLGLAHQIVIALISSLSGNSFLVQRMEDGGGVGRGDFYGYLENAVKNKWDSIARNYGVLHNVNASAAAKEDITDLPEAVNE
jgi:hypothetical protein